MPGYRFKLKTLLIFVIVASVVFAILSALPRIGRAIYYSERNTVEAALENVDSIENVNFSAFHDDIFEEVVSVSFSIKNRPESYLSVHNLEAPSDGLRLGRIGKIQLWRTGLVELNGGTKTTFFQSGIDFSQLRELLSEKIESVDDLVEHYDQILELVNSFPTAAGEATYQRGGNSYSYLMQRIPDSEESSSGSTQPR